MTLFQSLTYRSFALLWLGQTLSRLGDSLYQIALAWWVLEKTDSAAAMGLVFIFAFAPKLVFVLLGGVAVDQFPRARIMLASDAVRGGLTLLIAILASTQALEIWHIYLASLLFGFVEAFFLPAYTAILPDLLPPEARPSANSLTSLSAELTGVIGPTLGAWVVGGAGITLAFALDSASFALSVLCLLPLLRLILTRPEARPGNLWCELGQGFQTVRASTWLWFTILVLALLNLTGRSPMNVALPFLVKQNLQADVNTLGLLYSIFSLGAIVGAAWVGRTQIRRRGRVVYSGLIVVGAVTLAMGLPITLAGVLVAMFVLGGALAVSNLVWAAILQDKIPAERLGRVASINLLGSTSLLPIGFGLAGWATDVFGAGLVFVIGGLATAVLAVIGLRHPSIRELE